MLRVLVRVHGPTEDHDRVPLPHRSRSLAALGDDPAVQMVATLDDGALEQAASTRRRRVVDDRENAHLLPTVVVLRDQNSLSSVGGGSMPPSAGTPDSSSRPRRIRALRGAKSSRLLLNMA